MAQVKDKDLREALGEMQMPGVDMEISSGGRTAKIKDPRSVCLTLAELIEFKWSELDKHLDDAWPQDKEGNPEEWQDAELVKAIAEHLIDNITRFEFLREFSIGYLYRYKDGWENKGRTVLGEMSKATGLTEYYGNHDFELKINWLIWRSMTPWQRIALVYHELRHADMNQNGGPAIVGHHFEGFFDELELFGTKTYREWDKLAEAASKGERVDVRYHIEQDD